MYKISDLKDMLTAMQEMPVQLYIEINKYCVQCFLKYFWLELFHFGRKGSLMSANWKKVVVFKSKKSIQFNHHYKFAFKNFNDMIYDWFINTIYFIIYEMWPGSLVT